MNIDTQFIIETQVSWIRSGKIGCAYASALVNQRKLIGWNFVVITDATNSKLKIKNDDYLLSIVFPNENLNSIKEWALNNGFFLEDVDAIYEGLRIEIEDKKAWVLYFGPDSHWTTRQSPYPMLMFSVKIPKIYHAKVLMKGVLSVAHASLEFISEKQNELFWKQSHVMSKNILGYSPKKEDALGTFHKVDKTKVEI